MTVTRVLIIEGLINLIISLSKLTVGIMTQSTAVMADALHSFTDMINNIVAFVAMKIASAPADKEHPYGHQKFEYIAVFFLSVLLAVLGIEIIVRALSQEEYAVIDSDEGLWLLVGALVVNIVLSQWQRYWAQRLHSPILHADAAHTFSDVLTSVAVLAGWQLAAMGWVWIDKVIALLVALLVFRLSWQLFTSALPTLVDERANIEALSIHALQKETIKFNDIHEVSDVRTRWIGDQINIDLTLRVTPDLSLQQAHALSHRFEQHIKQLAAVNDVIIHVEPYVERAAPTVQT